MVGALEIRERDLALLRGEISLEEFKAWFVPATWSLERSDDGFSLAGAIKLLLAEHSSGHLEEKELTEMLKTLEFR